MRKLPYRLSISRTTERTTEIDATMIQIVKDPLLTAATVATVLARIALVAGMIGLSASLAAAVFRPDLLSTYRIGIGSGPQDDIPAAGEKPPFYMGQCMTWSFEGPVVQRLAPQFHRGGNQGG